MSYEVAQGVLFGLGICVGIFLWAGAWEYGGEAIGKRFGWSVWLVQLCGTIGIPFVVAFIWALVVVMGGKK